MFNYHVLDPILRVVVHFSMRTTHLSMCTFHLSMCTLHLSMCTLPVKHTHAFRWVCACLTSTHQHVHAKVKHVHTSVEHVHTLSWAYACFPVNMWMVNTYTSARARFSWAYVCFSLACAHFSWACARFQLSICTLPVEHVHTFSWAYAHFTSTHQHVHASVEHVHASVEHVHITVEHVHTPSWAYTRFQVSMCTLHTYTSTYTHLSWGCARFSWGCANFSWACAHSQLSIRTLF